MSAKNPLIQGTLILTISGLLTRILGFFYRIYLADALGAEALGIYQLIFPVYGLCFTLFAAGNQTALSRMIASREEQYHRQLLTHTIFVALGTALVLSLCLYSGASLVADHFLLEPRSAVSLRILTLSFPFCAVTSCINGYYYGRQKALIPATTQFLEQLTRMLVIYLILCSLTAHNRAFTCEMAVIGLCAGEMVSMIFNCLSMIPVRQIPRKKNTHIHTPSLPPFSIYAELFHLSLPLTANRFTINLLHSLESILLPTFLKLSGIGASTALSLYGILNGMTMPFILFPATVTNSLSVMLLPKVADAAAREQPQTLAHTASTGLRYSLLISILCTGIFLVYGYDMGVLIFHSETAGSYIRTLSWLCPFLYLGTTLGSILNGLDLAPTVFLQNILASAVRIIFVLFLVPHHGMSGYLWGMLAGSLCLTLMHGYTLHRHIPQVSLPVSQLLTAVSIIAAGLCFSLRLPLEFIGTQGIRGMLTLALRCISVCLIFLLYFFLTERQKSRI